MSEALQQRALNLSILLIRQTAAGDTSMLEAISDDNLVLISDITPASAYTRNEAVRLVHSLSPVTQPSIDESRILFDKNGIIAAYIRCTISRIGTVHVLTILEQMHTGSMKLNELQISRIGPAVIAEDSLKSSDSSELETVECEAGHHNYIVATYSSGAVERYRGSLKKFEADCRVKLFHLSRRMYINPAQILCLRPDQIVTYRHRCIHYDPRLHAALERAMKF